MHFTKSIDKFHALVFKIGIGKNRHCRIVEIFCKLPKVVHRKKIFARTSINLLNKNKQMPPELDSDQDHPKTQHDPCRRPSER